MYSWLSNPPFQPIPVEFAGDVSINIGQLQWTYVQEPYYSPPTGFEVYFPADNPVPEIVPYLGRDPEYIFEIGPLEYDTDYDWLIIPFNDYGWAENQQLILPCLKNGGM